jgi:hypothetical protein
MRRLRNGTVFAVAALVVSAVNMEFNQAKSNPDAPNFFASDSRIVQDDSYIN